MIKKIFLLYTACLLQSCATLEGPANPDDPYESFNRSMFAFNEGLDKYALKPLAKGYQTVTPDFVDTGVTNFFSNIDDILVVINDLLQLKFKQAAKDFSRFVFNTTFGLGGLIDFSTGFGLPKNNEDFGQTLGYWGLDAGPYIVLPVIGASSARDAFGYAVDVTQFDPVFQSIDDDKTKWSLVTLKYVDLRADLLNATNIIDETAPDKYAFIRDAWQQRRLNLVHDGNPPEEFSDDELFEDDLFTDDIKR